MSMKTLHIKFPVFVITKFEKPNLSWHSIEFGGVNNYLQIQWNINFKNSIDI